MQDFANHHTRWKYGGIAACDNVLIEFEVGMARYIVNIGLGYVAACPIQVSEITASLDNAADILLRIEHGNDNGIVG